MAIRFPSPMQAFIALQRRKRGRGFLKVFDNLGHSKKRGVCVGGDLKRKAFY